MATHGNLADPGYEPTDEELQELSRSAFKDVAKQHEQALSRLHAEIAALAVQARLRLESQSPEQAE
jgi:hypothetical protein